MTTLKLHENEQQKCTKKNVRFTTHVQTCLSTTQPPAGCKTLLHRVESISTLLATKFEQVVCFTR